MKITELIKELTTALANGSGDIDVVIIDDDKLHRKNRKYIPISEVRIHGDMLLLFKDMDYITEDY